MWVRIQSGSQLSVYCVSKQPITWLYRHNLFLLHTPPHLIYAIHPLHGLTIKDLLLVINDAFHEDFPFNIMFLEHVLGGSSEHITNPYDFSYRPDICMYLGRHSKCNHFSIQAKSQDPTTLINLNLNAPFTYVETYRNIINCSATPSTTIEWRTAYLGKSQYPGNTVTYTLQISTLLVTYIFPSLIVTLLSPGEVITMVHGFMKVSSLNLSIHLADDLKYI